MGKYLVKKWIFICFGTLILISILIKQDFGAISLETIENNKFYTLIITLFITYSIYHVAKPFLENRKIKRWIETNPPRISPSPIDFNLKKSVFNISLSANESGFDIIDGQSFAMTYYRSNQIIKTRRFRENKLDLKNISCVLMILDIKDDNFTLGHGHSRIIHIGKFNSITNDKKIKSHFEIESVERAYKSYDRENNPQVNEYELYIEFAKTLASLIQKPLIVYEKKKIAANKSYKT